MDLSRRASFDQVAELYDEVRPGYPEALVEDVIALSTIPPGGRILEIGCGPGKATLPFARRGYAMVCLELGERLAALAVRHCRPYPRVKVIHAAFEDWPVEERAFDLVMSAQAFHWISPEVGYPRAAAALRETGSLALFWNHQRVADPALMETLQAVYRQWAPELAEKGKPRPEEDLERETVAQIQSSGFFGPVTVRRYSSTVRSTADQYVKGLRTMSPLRVLDTATRHSLLSGIHSVVQIHGGEIALRCVTKLYVAWIRTDSTR